MQLEEFNPKLRHYKSGHLVTGQRVLVPVRAVALAARAVPNPNIELYGVVNGHHVVRRGETLGALAIKYHTTVKHLMALNHLQKDTIYIGQDLAVTGSATRRSASVRTKKTGTTGTSGGH